MVSDPPPEPELLEPAAVPVGLAELVMPVTRLPSLLVVVKVTTTTGTEVAEVVLAEAEVVAMLEEEAMDEVEAAEVELAMVEVVVGVVSTADVDVVVGAVEVLEVGVAAEELVEVLVALELDRVLDGVASLAVEKKESNGSKAVVEASVPECESRVLED